MNRTTRIAHTVSVVLMGVGVLVATADGFAQSYAGLYRWAVEQGLKGWKAETFPLLVDLFILVGEIGLFALALEGHRLTRKGLAWLDVALPFGLAAAGWGVSLAFNVGAVDGWGQQVTAAVAPIASMLGLLVLLRTVHRLITRVPVPEGAPGGVPGPALPLEGRSLPWWPAPAIDAPADVHTPVDGYALWDQITPDHRPVPAVPGPPSAALSTSTFPDRSLGWSPRPDDGPSQAGAPQVPVPDVPRDVLDRALDRFADDIRDGHVPGVRPIRRALNCGQPRAQEIRAYLAVLADAATVSGTESR